MTNKKRIEEIQKLLNQKYREMSPLQEERNKLLREDRIKEDSKRLGKCYVYRNSNGSEFWNLYVKVLGLSDWGIKVLTIEKTPHHVEISTNNEGGEHLFEKEIKSEVFEREFIKIFGEIYWGELK